MEKHLSGGSPVDVFRKIVESNELLVCQPKFTSLTLQEDSHSPLSLIQTVPYLVNKSVQISILFAHCGDFIDGMQHRGMVLAPKLPADLW